MPMQGPLGVHDAALCLSGQHVFVWPVVTFVTVFMVKQSVPAFSAVHQQTMFAGCCLGAAAGTASVVLSREHEANCSKRSTFLRDLHALAAYLTIVQEQEGKLRCKTSFHAAPVR